MLRDELQRRAFRASLRQDLQERVLREHGVNGDGQPGDPVTHREQVGPAADDQDLHRLGRQEGGEIAHLLHCEAVLAAVPLRVQARLRRVNSVPHVEERLDRGKFAQQLQHQLGLMVVQGDPAEDRVRAEIIHQSPVVQDGRRIGTQPAEVGFSRRPNATGGQTDPDALALGRAHGIQHPRGDLPAGGDQRSIDIGH